MTIEHIHYNDAVEKMVENGYHHADFFPKWVDWLARGDAILIFENQDLSHSNVGLLVTMPWTEIARPDMPSDGPLPAHAPDSATAGLGWRYTTRYVIRKDGPS